MEKRHISWCWIRILWKNMFYHIFLKTNISTFLVFERKGGNRKSSCRRIDANHVFIVRSCSGFFSSHMAVWNDDQLGVWMETEVVHEGSFILEQQNIIGHSSWFWLGKGWGSGERIAARIIRCTSFWRSTYKNNNVDIPGSVGVKK